MGTNWSMFEMSTFFIQCMEDVMWLNLYFLENIFYKSEVNVVSLSGNEGVWNAMSAEMLIRSLDDSRRLNTW